MLPVLALCLLLHLLLPATDCTLPWPWSFWAAVWTTSLWNWSSEETRRQAASSHFFNFCSSVWKACGIICRLVQWQQQRTKARRKTASLPFPPVTPSQTLIMLFPSSAQADVNLAPLWTNQPTQRWIQMFWNPLVAEAKEDSYALLLDHGPYLFHCISYEQRFTGIWHLFAFAHGTVCSFQSKQKHFKHLT